MALSRLREQLNSLALKPIKSGRVKDTPASCMLCSQPIMWGDYYRGEGGQRAHEFCYRRARNATKG
jgi:hypothetical protein